MAITTTQFKTLQDRVTNLETTMLSLASLSLKIVTKEASDDEALKVINEVMKQCVANGILLNSPSMLRLKEIHEKQTKTNV